MKAKKTETQLVRRCECGCEKFYAHQICRHDVLVNNDNIFDEEHGVYDSETPYGPYKCAGCGKEYEEIENIPMLPPYVADMGTVQVGDTLFECRVSRRKEANEGVSLHYSKIAVGTVSKFTPLRVYFTPVEPAPKRNGFVSLKNGYIKKDLLAANRLVEEESSVVFDTVPYVCYFVSSSENDEGYAEMAVDILRQRQRWQTDRALCYMQSIQGAVLQHDKEND